MKKSILIKIIFITLVLLVCYFIGTKVQAFNANNYKPNDLTKEEAKPVFTMGEKAFAVLRNLAAIIAILTIAIIGVRYIFGSVEQKAEYKATLVPWFVGAILVVMITSFLGIIEDLAKSI